VSGASPAGRPERCGIILDTVAITDLAHHGEIEFRPRSSRSASSSFPSLSSFFNWSRNSTWISLIARSRSGASVMKCFAGAKTTSATAAFCRLKTFDRIYP